MVYAILNLAYSKEHILAIRSTCGKYTIQYHCSKTFYILLYDI